MGMFATAILVAVSLYGPTAPCDTTPLSTPAQCAVVVHTADLADEYTVVDPATQKIVVVEQIGLALGVNHRPEVLVDSVLRGDLRRWRWGALCSLMLHEFGHEHGLAHSQDPLDRMYPILSRTDNYCRGKRPPQFSPGATVTLGPAATYVVSTNEGGSRERIPLLIR